MLHVLISSIICIAMFSGHKLISNLNYFFTYWNVQFTIIIFCLNPSTIEQIATETVTRAHEALMTDDFDEVIFDAAALAVYRGLITVRGGFAYSSSSIELIFCSRFLIVFWLIAEESHGKLGHHFIWVPRSLQMSRLGLMIMMKKLLQSMCLENILKFDNYFHFYYYLRLVEDSDKPQLVSLIQSLLLLMVLLCRKAPSYTSLSYSVQKGVLRERRHTHELNASERDLLKKLASWATYFI